MTDSEIPISGWECIGVLDVREETEPGQEVEYQTCESCGNFPIRFVHFLRHDSWDGELAVGCVCAVRLTDDPAGPVERERELQRKASRKAKWLSRKWRRSAKGNHFLNVGGINLVVFPSRFRGGEWCFRIGRDFSHETYPNIQQAKLALFDAFWDRTEG